MTRLDLGGAPKLDDGYVVHRAVGGVEQFFVRERELRCGVAPLET